MKSFGGTGSDLISVEHPYGASVRVHIKEPVKSETVSAHHTVTTIQGMHRRGQPRLLALPQEHDDGTTTGLLWTQFQPVEEVLAPILPLLEVLQLKMGRISSDYKGAPEIRLYSSKGSSV